MMILSILLRRSALFATTGMALLAQKAPAEAAEAEENERGRTINPTTTRNVETAMTTVQQPNPPPWPDTVKIITPDMTKEEILSTIEPLQDPPQEWTEDIDVDIDHRRRRPADDDPEKRRRTGYNSRRHFSEERHAILFAPGVYSVDVQVGYYVQVAGLGIESDDVVFRNTDRGPFVEALNKHRTVGGRQGSSLDTFWRSAENFRTEARFGQMWAVSQAAPLRRVRVAGDLILHDHGAYASGGHLANAVIEGGAIEFGSQQQWLCRSVDFNNLPDGGGVKNWTDEGALGGGWSRVFVDCTNPPEPRDGGKNDGGAGPSVTVSDPSITVEKPFVALRSGDGDGDGEKKKFDLRVPAPRRRNAKDGPLGADLIGANDDVRDFSRVKVAVATVKNNEGKEVPDPDVSAKINEALEEGLDVVLSPGMYRLKESLRMERNDQVILGLGLATLVAPNDGSPCVRVASRLEGVRIAGIMLEASVLVEKKVQAVATLLEWGEVREVEVEVEVEGGTKKSASKIADPGNPSNPGVLTDVFARVGGSNLNRTVSTDVMVRIHSGNVVGDNLWLWRADHVDLRPGERPNFPPLDYHQVVEGECPVETGIEVNGDDVTIHGLAVEHTTQHQTIWNGERGNVQFYQCEFPYDVRPHFGTSGFLGYKVNDSVKDHIVGGIGVYSNFRDPGVTVDTAIRHPRPHQVIHPFIVKLDNGGVIRTVVNGNEGGAAVEQGVPIRIEGR
uniref:Pectate lyase superfamily protein domain-containing protein n=1 Tax=Odontella aurita TaxID=265563 RepID=A0A7S4MRK7_9STRA|mmetsp:Transcript_29865/g.88765  ORF Transcript_29865/g.88765 Transcript_29865/m.88765 type:complete len:729 (+) Transcript_29865:609-2795(+)